MPARLAEFDADALDVADPETVADQVIEPHSSHDHLSGAIARRSGLHRQAPRPAQAHHGGRRSGDQADYSDYGSLETSQEILDALRRRGADSLIDVKRLPQVGDALISLAFFQANLAESFECAGLFQGQSHLSRHREGGPMVVTRRAVISRTVSQFPKTKQRVGFDEPEAEVTAFRQGLRQAVKRRGEVTHRQKRQAVVYGLREGQISSLHIYMPMSTLIGQLAG